MGCQNDLRLPDRMVPDDKLIPFYNVEVTDEQGRVHRMRDRTMLICGNSKGYNATGPWKLGAGISHHEQWRESVRQLTTAVTFQRESTHLILAGTANSSEDYIMQNQLTMMRQQKEIDHMITNVNSTLHREALISIGNPVYGPFRVISFSQDYLERAGLHDNWQLQDFILMTTGIDAVNLSLTGFSAPGIRINTNCPRIKGQKAFSNNHIIFNQISKLLRDIDNGLTYKKATKSIGLNSTVSVLN